MLEPKEIVRLSRQQRLLRQSDLAVLSGVSGSTISRIESGEISPSFNTVRKILNSIGFEASDQLRPLVTDSQMRRVVDEIESGEIDPKRIPSRMRIAAQTAPIIQRPGVRIISADLQAIESWAEQAGEQVVISSLEACSQEVSATPVVYVKNPEMLPFSSDWDGGSTMIVVPLTSSVPVQEGNSATALVSWQWALMDAIASPGRQADVALSILEQQEVSYE